MLKKNSIHILGGQGKKIGNTRQQREMMIRNGLNEGIPFLN